MSEKSIKLYTDDILSSILKIEEYLGNLTFDDFKSDSKTIDAVVRNLEIIGEAANNIPELFIEEHRDIPWREMITMRNKVIHEYFGVDIDILWQTVTQDLPKLKIQIENLN